MLVRRSNEVEKQYRKIIIYSWNIDNKSRLFRLRRDTNGEKFSK